MKNFEIRQAWLKQEDELFDFLSKLTLSKLFEEEYNRTKEINEAGDDYIAELFALSKNTSFDEVFREKVQSVKKLDDDSIIKSFKKDFLKLFKYINENNYYNDIQAIFVEYNHYEQHEGAFIGYGKQNYPIVLTPRYLSSEIDLTKSCFIAPDKIDFKNAWVNCNDFEWTWRYSELLNLLQELFKFHSINLMFKAMQSLDKNGYLDQFVVRPFSFYINEHDCEVATLYLLE